MLTHDDINALAKQIAKQVEASMLTKVRPGRWLKIPEACLYARMSKNTLMECINNNEINAKKRKKGGWVVDRLSIDRYNSCNDEDVLFNDIAKRAGL